MPHDEERWRAWCAQRDELARTDSPAPRDVRAWRAWQMAHASEPGWREQLQREGIDRPAAELSREQRVRKREIIARGRVLELERLRLMRLAEGGADMLQTRAGLVRGKHYTEWSDTIATLKREGQDEEAFALLLECVAATERESALTGLAVPPGWIKQVGIVQRKIARTAGRRQASTTLGRSTGPEPSTKRSSR